MKWINALLKNKKLVMTLLVRDEVDIIRYNIDYHLSHGVDFIIATDNGSIDGTRAILDEYEKRGLLYLIDEKNQDYSQAEWVNRMGKIAYEKYGADIIFHSDADEFWYPKSGNLKNEIQCSKSVVLRVNLSNVLLEDNEGDEKFPKDSRHRVIKQFATDNLEEDSKTENIYLFKYPPKVIFKTIGGLLDVSQGNHSAINTIDGQIKYSEDITILHFPVRCKKHFFNKVVNGGSAYKANRQLGNNIGWHWRRWYDSYEKGALDQEYRRLVLTREKAEELKKNGVIEDFSFENLLNNKI